RAEHGAALLGGVAVRGVGIRLAGGLLRGAGDGDQHRTISLHTVPDSRCDSDADDHDRAVGADAGIGRARTAARRVGIRHVGVDGGGDAVEGSDRGGVSGRRGNDFPDRDEAVGQMAKAAAVYRDPAAAGDRGAVACAGDITESPVLRFHDAQREGVVSRLLLVLLLQRASVPLPEYALSAGLQHGAAMAVLGISPAVVFPVEPVCACGAEVELSSAGQGVARAPAVPVLGGIYSGVLHVLDHAGVLLNAVLSGAGDAAGV